MAEAVNLREQAVPTVERVPLRLAVSVEALAWLTVGLLALVLRVAQLDVIPFSNAEAHEALAAWHVAWPDAPGSAPLSSSPLMFALNTLVMASFGSAGAAPRIMTALAGVALVLLPLLWRREMGRTGALVAGVLLTISPTALVSARTMSPTVWAVLLAVTGLWFARRFVRSRRAHDALLASVLIVSVALLADPTGMILLAVLLVGWVVAVLLSGDDVPEVQPMPRLRAALAEWPWWSALIASVIAVVLVGTLFFMHPRGLTQIGELLARGVDGLFRRPQGYPISFPLLSVLLYEPPLWLFGAIGAYFALNGDRLWGRFLTGWLFGALVAGVLYQGGEPQHGLWLVIPLAGLAGDVVTRLLRPVEDAYWVVPAWAVPLMGIGTVALLGIVAINLLQIARSLMLSNALTTVQVEPRPVVIGIMTLPLLLIFFFLGGSLWGSRAAWRGVGLGALLFLGVYSLSNAWGAAVTRADDARELWRVNPVSRDTALLRQTVIEASLRATGAPDRLTLTALLPDDGALAWLLRDYADLEYVPALERGINAPVVIAPVGMELTEAGARYVGQDFTVTHTWSLSDLRLVDLPMWIFYRETQARPMVGERVVVWVREDLYGLPPGQSEPASTGEESAP